jgi:DtxR family transcriptional regulator, Mn-dependent transcriptional regulator
MSEHAHLTESLEMYLKAVYVIQQKKQAARVTDIALEVGVIPSSVTGALRTLSKLELINHAPYDIITLTPSGLAEAEGITRKYAALRDFFVKVLGVEESTAQAEACRMEHRISEVVFDRLLRFVQYYEECPYAEIRYVNDLGYVCACDDTECGRCALRTKSDRRVPHRRRKDDLREAHA